MTLSLIAFTAQGHVLAQQLAEGLRAQGEEARLTQGFGHEKHPPLRVWAGEAMLRSEGLVFVGATGIAVRAIAPHLRSKQTDPAVVVIDEQGRFAIALLSGHTGGANRLAQRLAAMCGAVPVITTATDGRGAFAVDVWAMERGIALANPGTVKLFSAALLAGEPVGVASAFPIEGDLPQGLVPADAGKVGLYIGWDGRVKPFDTALYAVPRALALGIGCRRGTAQAVLMQRIDAALAQIGSMRGAVQAVHTIDRKADEPGLLAACEANGWPLRAFTAGALQALPGHFTASAFVQDTVGVDNVCERAAVATGGRLLLPKQAGDGVTVAIAALPYEVSFAEVEACASRL